LRLKYCRIKKETHSLEGGEGEEKEMGKMFCGDGCPHAEGYCTFGTNGPGAYTWCGFAHKKICDLEGCPLPEKEWGELKTGAEQRMLKLHCSVVEERASFLERHLKEEEEKNRILTERIHNRWFCFLRVFSFKN